MSLQEEGTLDPDALGRRPHEAETEAEEHRGSPATPQKLGRGRERARPCRHLDFGLPASRTARKSISVVVDHPASGPSGGRPRTLTQPPNVKQRAAEENKKETQQAHKANAWTRPRRRQEGMLPPLPLTRDRKPCNSRPSLAGCHVAPSSSVRGWMSGEREVFESC